MKDVKCDCIKYLDELIDRILCQSVVGEIMSDLSLM